jgi:hypothetical protein
MVLAKLCISLLLVEFALRRFYITRLLGLA